MITLRPAAERGTADHGWLQTAHTFSFADYFDPRHVGFRTLRVVNEDTVAPAAGFGMHPHRDMEILTWILQGALQHTDSLGNTAVIRPGEVQVMSAGTGVLHSEVNPSRDQPVHLLQIWIVPNRRGLAPRYDQRRLDRATLRDRLVCIAAPPGDGGIVELHQDARIFATELQRGARVALPLRPGRAAWVQVARGALQLGDVALAAGDGAAVEDQPELTLVGAADGPSEALVFDLA